MTAAHDQRLTLHLLTHVPEHAPREDDPRYHLFEQAKARLKKQGLWKCIIDDDLCGGRPELHHSHVEFSQANAADPAKVEKALGLHFDSDEEFQAWIESPGNLEVLCLPGDEDVLMADGELRSIAKVCVGDFVIGHDGRSHVVTATSESNFAGSLVAIDGRRMTGNHPVLTERGWLAASAVRVGDLACFVTPADTGGISAEFGVLDAHVLAVGGVQSQVLGAIIGGDAVDVVDGLGPGQRSPDDLFHDQAVLHDEAPPACGPVDDANVSGRLQVALLAASLAGPRQRVERLDSTGVGAVLPAAGLDVKQLRDDLGSASQADDGHVGRTTPASTFTGTFPAARRIALGEFLGDAVVVFADRTSLDDRGPTTVFERRWRPVLHVSALPYQGKVYDIEVPGCQSFIATDLVVHNCATHHRMGYGIHVLPEPLWQAVRFHRQGLAAPAEFIPARELTP